MEGTAERQRMKHDAEVKIKEMQFRTEKEMEDLRIAAKAEEDKRKATFEVKRLETEHLMKEKEHEWKMQMEDKNIKGEKEKEKMRLENERIMNEKKLDTEKVMKHKELTINREIEGQKIKSKEDTAKYAEDKRWNTVIKATEIKVSAIQYMEMKRIETAQEADKDRKELLMAALTHVTDPEIMKIVLSSTRMLDSSVFASGCASESVSKIQVRLDLLSAVTNEEEEDHEKTDNEDEEERAWQS